MNSSTLLSAINKHPRDDRIQFEESTHTYTVDGVKSGWVSCTGFHHCFFGQFDADAVIAKMMKSSNWYESKYFGMTSAQIKQQWADKGSASSTAGTKLHLDIENFYNSATTPSSSSKEWDHFMNFHTTYASRGSKGLTAFRTEWTVFDVEHKVSGSIDMVYKKPDGTLAIYDWKRVEDIKTENKFQSGLGPLSHLPDTNYWHYTMQLNIYRYILQKNYGVVVSELALVILHPARPSFLVMKLNFMDDEVNDMMAARARALAIEGNNGSSPIIVL